MARRGPLSAAKRKREADKRAKRQAKQERRAKRAEEKAQAREDGTFGTPIVEDHEVVGGELRAAPRENKEEPLEE